MSSTRTSPTHPGGDAAPLPPAEDDSREARQRRAILRGAAAALREHGSGVGMAEVARTAGVGRATLYRHFATRDVLLEALSQFAADESVRALLAADLAGVPVPEAIVRATRALLMVGREYWTVADRGPAEDPTARELAVSGPLVELAARGQQEGVLRTDLPAARLGLLHGVLIQGAQLYPQLLGEDLDEAAGTVARLYTDGAAASAAPLLRGPLPGDPLAGTPLPDGSLPGSPLPEG